MDDKRKLVAVPALRNCRFFNPSLGTIQPPNTNTGYPLSKPSPANPPVTQLHPLSAQQPIDWEYNVYAKPFIPLALRSINDQPGHISVTESKHKIDSISYIESFLGKSFVPHRSTPPTPVVISEHEVEESKAALTTESYLKIFQLLFAIERAAKESENETYSLYKVPLRAMPLPNGQTLYALVIPGLREGSPLVEMGDIIQLRQLWTDNFGNPIGVPDQLQDPYARAVIRNWQGIQYNASVFAVNRALETVILKITGLKPTTMMFNVVLPLKQKWLQAQWDSLYFVYQHLQKTALTDGALHHRQDYVNGSLPSCVDAQNQRPEERNEWLRRMLFPVEADGVMQTQLRKVPLRGLFDSNLNYEQIQAINSVCEAEYGVLPLLISGPPGTGKTKTLVEITLQLLNSTETAHIIICAPSDQAADTLALRLRRYMTPTQMLRLNGPQRADNEISQQLLPYCYREHDIFYLPSFYRLMSYNVVVTTTRDVSILADTHLTNCDLYTIEKEIQSTFNPEDQKPPRTLHWGALLLDEAAQATELEILPALSVIMPPTGYPTSLPQPRFIMAGDHNQLGPRTASRNPQVSTSLFARLFDRPIYASHPLSRFKVRPSAGPPVLKKSMLPMLYPPFVNLIRNYRSHPAILSVPSSLFYNDTLVPEAPLESTPLQHSSLWQGFDVNKWPVLYIPHTGPDDIEYDGGGWYNISEAREACNLAQRLVSECEVKQTDIVIMSPFAAQVKYLRRMIRSSSYGGGSGLWKVNIGPLEAFQGLESRIVIICTTRTRERFVDTDKQKGLGIVGQKRKMNVALTRAKAALFVIGSPTVLARDEHWTAFLAFCWRNGLYRVWKPDGAMIKTFEGCKMGALEMALLVREEGKNGGGPTLGSATATQDIIGDDESWIDELRAVIDHEDEEVGEAEEDETEETAETETETSEVIFTPAESHQEVTENHPASDTSSSNGVPTFLGSVVGDTLHRPDGSTTPSTN